MKIGHWPWRPLPGLDALLRAMDAFGIERAAVSSLNASFYLDPQEGNDEVFREAAPYRDRLAPLAVLRPNFAGWEDDLETCLGDYGMRGVLLYPNYHRFTLEDPGLGHLMGRAAELRVPVCVQAGLEDPRRQFEREMVFEVPVEEIGAFARAYPAVTVVALGLKFGQPEQTGEPMPENFRFDTSNYEAMGELEAAVGKFGAGKILFGTNAPLFNTLANVEKVRRAAIAEMDRRAIAEENAVRLLGVESSAASPAKPRKGVWQT